MLRPPNLLRSTRWITQLDFYLAKISRFDGITLPYGGVLIEHQGHGHFSGLIAQAKAMEKPLRAEVKRANKSAMAARLVKMGFVKKAGFALFQDEDVFIWTPG